MRTNPALITATSVGVTQPQKRRSPQKPHMLDPREGWHLSVWVWEGEVKDCAKEDAEEDGAEQNADDVAEENGEDGVVVEMVGEATPASAVVTESIINVCIMSRTWKKSDKLFSKGSRKGRADFESYSTAWTVTVNKTYKSIAVS